MKALILVLLLAIMSIPVNAQQSKIYDDYLNNANKQAKRGGTLILTGIGTTVGGGILLAEYGFWYDPPGPNGHVSYSGPTIWCPISIVIIGGGIALFSNGVVSLIAGSVKRGWAQKHLQMSMVSYMSPGATRPINGIGVIIRF
jgi:hypothetical protein